MTPGSATEVPLVAYRFCRPDDIPLLVRAVNECWGVHDPAAPPLTVEAFRHEMKMLDVWPSNSMVALAGDGQPVAVLIGTKRATAVRVLRVGVRPGHQRQGHGRHLVTSLSQKLAVLGPPRLLAEVPAAHRRASEFLEAVGWRFETELVDRLRSAPRDAAQPVPEDLVIPVTVAELDAAGALEISPHAAWGRQRETLMARADHLVGAAVSTPDRVEAFLLAEPVMSWDERSGGPGSAAEDGPLDVVALGCLDPQRAEFLLGLLFRWLSHTSDRPLRIPRLAPGEVPSEALAAAGFEASDRWLRYVAEARPL